MLRTASALRPTYRPERDEPPAPRQQAAYRCTRGHDFEVTFAAEVNPPQAWDCRCGAHAGRSLPADDEDDHERHQRFVMERRSPAERQRALAARLAEVAAMRQAGKLNCPE
jgi:hypothetical protein